MKVRIQVAMLILVVLFIVQCVWAEESKHQYNGPYQGRNLDKIAFPIGGIGAGMFCVEGTGTVSHVSVRHQMDFYNEPIFFSALYTNNGTNTTAKVLEGAIPDWKIFGPSRTGNGAGKKKYGFPRFENASFTARFPFSTIELSDDDVPVDVSIRAWSPFTPGNSDDSSLPVGAMEFTFTNSSTQTVESVYSFNAENFMSLKKRTDRINSVENGFMLTQPASDNAPQDEGYFAVYTDDSSTIVDHCWFRGRGFDPITVTWNTISSGRTINNPPLDCSAPGASLFVPFSLEPGKSKTIRVMFTWYVGKSALKVGSSPDEGPAFGLHPSQGTAEGQQKVSGFEGHGLVNTYDPKGDDQIGMLYSPEFVISEKYIQFLIGGGKQKQNACINLKVDGKAVRTATGRNSETLSLETWDVSEYHGKKAKIEIVDQAKGTWGHILVDHIVATNVAASSKDKVDGQILADFEGKDYQQWTADQSEVKQCCSNGTCKPKFYQPWYAGRFKQAKDVIRYWRRNYERLRTESETFSTAFYDTTLPPEVIEAVAANLTILKTPTVLRQTDGRLWCWEGCCESYGCCPGSCTHVWNYAQAIPHLFPDLERSLRATEFNENQNQEGHQQFRANLPISEAQHTFHAAADGQLGGIMKVYREWRISGDTQWLKEIWPKVRISLDYCIRTWDPRHAGALEEPHHNTYDIEYWGPEGHCTSFYAGALNAAVQMGRALGDETDEYADLLKKSKAYLENKLYNGQYFYQRVATEGLNATFKPLDVDYYGTGYASIVKAINAQGPKYQYGTGCLSDGVLGFWISKMCGLDEIVDTEKISSHLLSVHKYNLRKDLFDHSNPQRSTYALGHEGGLLLCSWPNGNKPMFPFRYSDEVWTGIEYQVASHLMMHGQVQQGLEIVRACRDRYNGCVRNPFNEYECGHWYGRAMSSYGLIQGLTGLRYDAVDKTLYVDSNVGDNFKAFLSTAEGFAVAGLQNGKSFLDVRSGRIDVKHVYVSGVEKSLK